MGENIVTAKAKYPCLLSVESVIFTPRMPTLKLKMLSKNKQINKITLSNLADQDEKKYGLAGSATRVQKIYPPVRTKKQELINLSGSSAAEYINEILEKLEVSKGESI